MKLKILIGGIDKKHIKRNEIKNFINRRIYR